MTTIKYNNNNNNAITLRNIVVISLFVPVKKLLAVNDTRKSKSILK